MTMIRCFENCVFFSLCTDNFTKMHFEDLGWFRQLAVSFLLVPLVLVKLHLNALAMELLYSEKNMIRIDMSEYMEQHSVSRLIGASRLCGTRVMRSFNGSCSKTSI